MTTTYTLPTHARTAHPDVPVPSRGQAAAPVDPQGTTWLPAPGYDLPAAPGRPPMTGYLVLVPAGQVPPGVPPAAPGPGGLEAAAAPPESGEPRGGIHVDAERRTAEVDGRPLDLTYLEYELLAHLLAHPHRVHTREALVGAVWGYGHVGDGRTVDVHIARLRRKLGPDRRAEIVTVRRVGYKYVPGDPR